MMSEYGAGLYITTSRSWGTYGIHTILTPMIRATTREQDEQYWQAKRDAQMRQVYQRELERLLARTAPEAAIGEPAQEESVIACVARIGAAAIAQRVRAAAIAEDVATDATASCLSWISDVTGSREHQWVRDAFGHPGISQW